MSASKESEFGIVSPKLLVSSSPAVRKSISNEPHSAIQENENNLNSHNRALFDETPMLVAAPSATVVILGDEDDVETVERGAITDTVDKGGEAEAEGESEDERRRREQKETDELIWQIIQEDQENIFRAQMEGMRRMGEDDIAEEDRLAMQAAMGIVVAVNNEAAEQGEVEEEREEEGEEVDVDNMDYDQLLQLGEEMGDVRRERWRLCAPDVLRSLQEIKWEQGLEHNGISEESDAKAGNREVAGEEGKKKRLRVEAHCAVCMEAFVAGDTLKVLPCSHGFHSTCTEGWIANNDTCPLCKQRVV